jgi:mono/diheme cytochrome c family protein
MTRAESRARHHLGAGKLGRIIILVWTATWAILLARATAVAQVSPQPEFTPEQVRAGSELYERYCANCHGARMEGVEADYDLRKFGPNDRPRFYGAVLSGVKTMPPWNGLLTLQQVETLWAYAMSRRSAVSPATDAAPANVPSAPLNQAWPCEGDSPFLVDAAGMPVWISSAELKNRALSMPPLALPSSLTLPGKLTVDVIVDSQGRVKCSRVPDGQPLLQSALAEAVSKWIIQPFSTNGQPVAVYGHLDFVFDSSR